MKMTRLHKEREIALGLCQRYNGRSSLNQHFATAERTSTGELSAVAKTEYRERPQHQLKRGDEAMAIPMNPSDENKMMTDGQIERLVDLLRQKLIKNRNEDRFVCDAVQAAIGSPALSKKLFGAVWETLYWQTYTILRENIQVNRRRRSEEMIAATECNFSRFWEEEMRTIPNIKGPDSVNLYLFRLTRYNYGVEELMQEYESRRLRPADPYSLAALNEFDHDFVRTHEDNRTVWKSSKGWRYLSFGIDAADRRSVYVGNVSDEEKIFGRYWFAGVLA